MKGDPEHLKVVEQLREAIGEKNILGGNINFSVTVQYEGKIDELRKNLEEQGLAGLVNVAKRESVGTTDPFFYL